MKVIIRPLYSLMNKAKINDEMDEDAIIWTDALIAIVPITQIKPSWEMARDKQQGSFAPNFFDVKNAYFEIKEKLDREDEKTRESKPFERCSGKKYHVFADGTPDVGQTIAQNPHTLEDEFYPCALCRPKDLEKVRKCQIAFFGEIKRTPIKLTDATPKISRTEEVYLPMMEAIEICAEYNGLVIKLVDETEARKNLYIEFNEGANRFHYQNRSVPLFTADYMRNIIADYKKRVEVKETV